MIVFEPFYPFMLGAIHQAGAVPRVVTLRAPDFAIDEAALREAAASPRARMLVLNSPHNPSGRVAGAAELGIHMGRVCGSGSCSEPKGAALTVHPQRRIAGVWQLKSPKNS